MARTATGVTLVMTGMFEGQAVVVTGGGNGIGAATCRAFAAQGARVAVVDIDEAAAQAVAGTIGTAATVYVTDVTDAAQVATMAEQVLADHGRVDVLVNNVGHWVKVVPFHLSGPEDWAQQLGINLVHVFAVTRAFLGTMLTQGKGVIVNVSSVEGVRGYPPDPVYASTKAAVNHFTKSLAVSYGRKGIRVVGIAPDITDSAQVPYSDEEKADPRWNYWAPIARPGTPEDNADVIVALASEQCRFVTGTVVNTDGGTVAGSGWFWNEPARRFVNRPAGLNG